MKFISTILAPAFLTLIVSCGGGGTDSLVEESMTELDSFLTTMESIGSKESAEAAAPKLKEIAARFKALGEKVEALPEEEKKALEATMKAESKELEERMKKMMMGLVAKPEAFAVLGPILEEMSPE